MPTTICLINQKGGCGKSSTCFHLAGALAHDGHRVLLVDADPQGSLSQGFLGSAVVEDLEPAATLADLFAEADFLSTGSQILRPTQFDRIAICPSNQHLSRYNVPMTDTFGVDQYLLRDFLQFQTDFDVVLIDCPPNLYRCSWTAMMAADYVIIPVPPEDFGTQGLRAVHQAIAGVQTLNPALQRYDHLVTRYDRRLLIHQSYAARLREIYPDSVLESVIPEASAFKVSLACRQPVQCYSPKSVAAELTRKLSREILERIHGKTICQRVA